MATLGWYARRLRSMDKRELLWRTRRAGLSLLPATRWDQRPDMVLVSDGKPDWEHALERFRADANRPVLLDRQHALAISEHTPTLVAGLLDSADRVAKYSFRYFGHPEVSLKQPINWQYDPIAKVQWPDVDSRRIDHRVAAGDAKWIWELNRLQHLPWLAQAWLFTGDSRYSSAAFEQLDSWIDQNPPGQGIAWRGAFEAGVRAISIAVALQGLRDAPELTVERYRRIVRVLANSAWRCWRDRSRFSSANNHLIGEMAGLAVVAILLPELKLACGWEKRAVETLCVEADRQIMSDGSGAEQAVGYQMFAVELLHVVAALLAQRDGGAPRPIAEAIARSSAFLAAVVGQDDPDPRYGDNDEGFALRLGPEPVRTVRDHLGIVAASGFGTVSTEAGRDSLGAQWYGAVAQSVRAPGFAADSARAPTTGPDSHFAADGGLVVLRDGRRRVTMDVGPLGYLSIAAHGHADALAVTLSDDGQDLIGDPGTGSFYGHPQWRAMMRGTRAHATVSVDGQDQSVIGGAFLWSQHAHTHVRGVDLSAGVVDAEHDGYTRLKGRVMHRRWLIAPPENRAVLIVDLISGDGIHEVRTSWPLHPSLEVRRVEGGHTVWRNESRVLQILYAASAKSTHDQIRGDTSRNLGWWSHRLESRTPAWWLSAACVAATPLVMATLLTPGDGVSTVDLNVTSQDGRIETTWAEGGAPRYVTIEIAGSAVVRHSNQRMYTGLQP